MPKPVLWFVTDPMCSWCWGMLPDFEQVRLHLGDSVEYELMLGGVQLGAKGQLASYNETMLFSLWREVTAVTGQQFSGRLPNTPGFRYHSEM
ncbi:MAG: DsbA family protein, partial [Pseudomonadales bacterium]|nr:DsbA family protein [Pseudomonadales bacterium]